MQSLLKYQKLTLWWALFVLVMCNIKIGKAGHSPLFFAGFDKLVHCGFFFMFGALANYGLVKQHGNFTWAAAVKVFITAVVYGAAIEIIQKYLFPWRGAEWADLFADSVGAGMAAFSSLIIATAIRDEKN